ncbi:MAG: hypothetical protein AVDCRST_MAG64-2293 [uncultured Phycisphaerae bacterium]|uniref:Lipoprotein n=1 Tax=uncultured Phycisphaerae bacterium TaxID=904963 RepID=A0A6J4PA74_9BACT|nr:MAG: hypothetical protein AVDCRST_MAG64-2293 [uncultured Phycisphaerae bacterium]
MIASRLSLPLLLLSFTLASGCGPREPRESRDVAGARVEVNPPNSEAFVKKVNSVQPGTPKAAVVEALGEPDERRVGTVNATPEPGPTERLAELATPGTQYEQWVYKRGDSHYHVFFTRAPRGSRAGAEVLTVKSMPKDAVY